MPQTGDIGNQKRLQTAIEHLAKGFAAFPVWSTTPDGVCKCPKKADCDSAGKHPVTAKGFLDATTDEMRLRAMLTTMTEPNYGLIWPAGGDIVVILDVDGADWSAKVAELKQQYGPLPKTKTTRTPSGGLHLFYRWPDGIPVPDTNHLHGFVARFPNKGYVVGPGSQINGKVYRDEGIEDMAVLPPTWAVTEAVPAKRSLIVIEEGKAPYALPERIPTGTRHDAITAFVGSLWNKDISLAAVAVEVRDKLVKRFDEQMDDHRLSEEIEHAYRTAGKKWVSPATGMTSETTESVAAPSTRVTTEVGLLPSSVSVAPDQMDVAALTTSPLLIDLMSHFRDRTDAGYEGLLVTSLTYLGALMGHTPSCFYGSREQHTNVMAMLVGTTGASRKGTTVDLVRGVMSQVTDMTRKMKHSANSGEAVIAIAERAKGDPILIEEEEFDRFLTSKGRDGNTLSSILRQAFDDVPLTSATVAKVMRADVHHVAMLGNVTREDIAAKMAQVDLKNGFANRILWTGMFPRTNIVTVHDNAIEPSLRDGLRDVLAFTNLLTKPLTGGVTHQIDNDARDMLAASSARYGAGVGLAPFLSRRLDTIAARIALIYACLDRSRRITLDHVTAALDVTDYAYASARWVFPETTGDTRADFVLRHLREAGFLNYTELEVLIGKKPLDRQQVFDLLEIMGYARQTTRPRRDGKPGQPQKGIELV